MEDIVKPELDSSLRQKIASDLFIEWLKKQRTQIEVIKNLEVGETTIK